MADRKRKMTTGAKYVAVGALTETLNQIAGSDASTDFHENGDGQLVAAYVVEKAWDVEFFPNAGRVTITLDVNQLVNGDPAPQH